MNKKFLYVVGVAALLSGGAVRATTSQFRTPLQFTQRLIHYPLPPVEDTWWYEGTGHDRNETGWSTDVFQGLYTRYACKSFYNGCEPCDPCDTVTRKKASLAQLWFGASSFTGQQIFAGGTLAGCTNLSLNNAALGFAAITPQFEYNEYGAYVGLETQKIVGCNNNWCIGGRISMPVKVIEVRPDSACQLEESLDDVVQMRAITDNAGGAANNVDFAARLDFLTALSIPNGDNTCLPFVSQSTQSGFLNTLIDQIQVSRGIVTTPQVYAIAGSCMPAYPFRKDPSAISPDALPADGAAATGSISYFNVGVDYQNNLFQDPAAKQLLWIVPATLPSVPDQLTGSANTISQALLATLGLIADSGGLKSVSELLGGSCNSACGIDLCGMAGTCVRGQGDLDAEMYAGYLGNNWFSNLVFGVTFPTGKKIKNAGNIYQQTTGNNGHFEVAVRAEGGWQPLRWFAFKLEGQFSHACKATEKRAAPFTGATVRNIGPTVDAHVSWNYFLGHADLTFLHPHNPEIGWSIGYELFAKGKDHVSAGDDCSTKCAITTATDCLGRTDQPLNFCQLEACTRTLTHKLRGEVFTRWYFFELNAGVSAVLAGRNAMQETEAHIGAVVYF